MERDAVVKEMAGVVPRLLDFIADPPKIRSVLDQVTSDAATKLHGIYTDVGHDGSVQTPDLVIDRNMAETAIQAAQSVTGLLELMDERGGWREPKLLKRIQERNRPK